MKLAFIASNWLVASNNPVTPMQCPKKDLVETSGMGWSSMNFATPRLSALSLASVPLPWPLMQPRSVSARPESASALASVR